MIKVGCLTLNESKIAHRYSHNNDGVFGNVHFVDTANLDLESCDHNIDYVVVDYQYAMADFSVCVAPENLWLVVGEPYEFPVKQCFDHRLEFAKVISCRGQRIKNGDFMPICTPSWHDRTPLQDLQTTPYPEKTKTLAWVTSKKMYFKGHAQRLRLVHKLQQAGICDMFGNGFQYVDSKVDCLRHYRYSLAMENTIDPNYIAEKITDCYLAHAMPLYIGSPDITKYFPEKSMVQLDWDDKHLLEKIKDISQSDLYSERRPYIEEARQIVLGNMNMFNLLAQKIEHHHATTRPSQKVIIPVKGKKTSRFIPKKILYRLYQAYYNTLLD